MWTIRDGDPRTASHLDFHTAPDLWTCLRQTAILLVSQPTNQPTDKTTNQNNQPNDPPTNQPASQPTNQPASQQQNQPANQPTNQPASQPTNQPDSQPTNQPTNQPDSQPTNQPTSQPTNHPDSQPTNQPTNQPSCQPRIEMAAAGLHGVAGRRSDLGEMVVGVEVGRHRGHHGPQHAGREAVEQRRRIKKRWTHDRRTDQWPVPRCALSSAPFHTSFPSDRLVVLCWPV